MDSLEKFVKDFFEGKVDPYLKSEPVPDDNSAPVKVYVAYMTHYQIAKDDVPCHLGYAMISFTMWCNVILLPCHLLLRRAFFLLGSTWITNISGWGQVKLKLKKKGHFICCYRITLKKISPNYYY